MRVGEISHEPNSFFKPLLETPDEEDYAVQAITCEPRQATLRLHELVPLLKFIGAQVDEIGVDRTVISAPLQDAAMNQNGTHQASVFYLLADYALGVAIAGAMPGVYVTGINDRCRALPVQCWLKRGLVEHLAPGTGTLKAVGTISQSAATVLRRELIRKGRGEIEAVVHIYQDEELIARAEHCIGLYADLPKVLTEATNIFQANNQKLSALLIAGLRINEFSQAVAGIQGRAIAARMAGATPALPNLIRGRDVAIHNFLAANRAIKQVLALGVGLDVKSIVEGLASERPWFCVDLPSMVKVRARVLSAAGYAESKSTRIISADLRSMGWEQKVVTAGFDVAAPSLILLEGLSMYLPIAELRLLLSRIGVLCASTSLLWMDHVRPSAFDIDDQQVKDFFSNMNRLGEPFVTAFEHSEAVCGGCWVSASRTDASEVLGMPEHLVLSQYAFSVLKKVEAG